MIEVMAMGFTVKTKDGVVLAVMPEAEMPPDCMAVFVKKGDQYQELLKLIKDSQQN